MGFRSFVAVMGIVLLLVACRGDIIPEGEVDFRSCREFLTLDEIKLFLGKPHIVFRAEDVTKEAKEQNPAIEAACRLGLEMNDKTAAIGLAAIKFESELSAIAHLETLTMQMRERKVEGDRMEFDTFTSNSYEIVPQELGIAGIVGYRQGPHIVQLHSTAAAGHPYLADVELLVTLAQVIQGRLP